MAYSPTDWVLCMGRALRDGDQSTTNELLQLYQTRAAPPCTPDSFQWLERTKGILSKSPNRALKAMCCERLGISFTPRSRQSSPTHSPNSCVAQQMSASGVPSSICTRSQPRSSGAPSPGARSVGPGSPTAVLCFQASDGSYKPASDMISLKKAAMRTLLDKADATVNQLSSEITQVVNARDNAAQQASELQRVIQNQCTELRTILDAREGLLITKLEKMKEQYSVELNEEGHKMRDYVARLGDLCDTTARLLDHEKDPNAFMSQITLPEMAIADLLEQSIGGFPPTPLNLTFNIDAALSALQLLDVAQMPEASVAVHTKEYTAVEATVPYKFSLVLELLLSQWLSDPLLQSSIRTMVAAHAGVPVEACRVLKVRSGSTVVDFEVLAAAPVADVVLENVERLFVEVQAGTFHLHGVHVITMTTPVRVKISSSEIPIDEQLDAILAARAKANPQPEPRLEGTGPNATPNQLKDKTGSSVVCSEELWSASGEVSLTVREHKNAVSFVGSNFGANSTELLLRCNGLNVEPFDTSITLPPGLLGCTLGQSLVLDPKRSWSYEFKWSVQSIESPATSDVSAGVAMSELMSEMEQASLEKAQAVSEEDFVLAAKLHTRCQQLQIRMEQLGDTPKVAELQRDLEVLKNTKEELVAGERFDEAAVVKEQMDQLQKMIDAAS